MAGGDPARVTGGFITIQFVAATALSLAVFVWAANLVVFTYARGAVRAAVDDGARAGASGGDCVGAAAAVIADLLAGAGQDVQLTCRVEGRAWVSRAEVVVRGWLPPVPDWAFAVEGVARSRAP